MRTVSPRAMQQRPNEFIIAPGANTRLPVRRDVRRQNRPKRSFDRAPTRERAAAARRGVTSPAIGNHRQITPTLDCRKILVVIGIRRKDRCRTSAQDHQSGSKNHP